MFDLKTMITSGVTATVVALVVVMLVGSNTPAVGGDTRFPNSDLSASSLTTTSGDLFIGGTGATGCIAMQDSDNGGLSYVTILNGTLVATSTASCL